jgi:hypothetical protein
LGRAAANTADVSFCGSGVLSEHKHGFPAFLVQLFEQYQRPLVQSQTALLISIDNIQRILPPVGRDVVLLKRNRKDLVAWIVNGNAE